MHENTQRRWLLAGFWAVCIMPTLWTIGWILSHQLDYRTKRIERAISRELALDVRIGRVSYPRPRQVLLHEVSILDPETAEPLATARLLDVVRLRQGAIVVASESSLQLSNVQELWELLEHRCLRRRWPEAHRFDLYADDMTLKSERWGQTVALVAQCEDRPSGPQVDINFRLASDANPQPIHLRLKRRRIANELATVVHLACPQPIPTSLLGPDIELPRYFGTAAKFQGSLTVVDAASGPPEVGLRQVTVSEIDLTQLVQWSPYHLSGTAIIHCPAAQFDAQGMNATIRLETGPGQIGAPLLRSLADGLKCRWDARAVSRGQTPIPFIAAGIQVELAQTEESAHFAVHGICQDSTRDLLIMGDQGSLLSGPVLQRAPIELANALLPRGATTVPAVRESSYVLRWLRLPSTTQADVDQPRARIQLTAAEEDSR